MTAGNVLLALGLMITHTAVLPLPVAEDKHFWQRETKNELDEALNLKWNMNTAKNVILFVGDGMGVNTITAARMFKGDERSKLSWEKFPHVGMLKTYSVDKQVPDSASTATALFCGVKTNYHTMGVDANVAEDDCEASQNPDSWVSSIIQWAQDAGKDTGFVTTTRVTHATPSALYAHCPNRKWECEATMPVTAHKCKDIARQLIEDNPGKRIKVIMGGGRQCLVSNSSGTPDDPTDLWACYRTDGRDLIQSWKEDKKSQNFTYAYLKNNADLFNLDTKNTDFVLGIFANGHFAYENTHSDGDPLGMPTLENMTSAAIKILKKNSNGYVLVVEGGLIDFSHHRGHARHALYETLALDKAVNSAVKASEESQDTLLIVTSDHDHNLVFSGYPQRGNNILGIAGKSKIDKLPYTTLSYGTGDMYSFKYSISDTGVVRQNPMDENFTSFEYHSHAGILTDEALHGGGDVAVYAQGPMAHLFHSIHEQTFVAHVIGYATQTGLYRSNTTNIGSSKSCFSGAASLVLPVISLLLRI